MSYLVFISTFFPSDYGARPKVLFNYMKSLAMDYGNKVSLIVISNDCGDYKKPEFLEQMVIIPQPGIITQCFNIIINALVLRKTPMQAYFYWSSKNEKKVTALINNLQPNLVICEMIRTGLFGKNMKLPKILDMADLLSRRYRQQLPDSLVYSNIAGQYEKLFHPFLRKAINSPQLRRFILKNEFLLTEKFENKLPGYFDVVSLVSTYEVDLLKRRSSCNNIIWLPNAVDIDLNTSHNRSNDSMIISFIGVLDNPHNEQSVIYFLKRVFPSIIESIPDVQFNILGRNPTPTILDQAKNFNQVQVVGYVENLDDWIKSSAITVVPLKVGSGVKTKIFESLKLGIPVVSTTLGAEGVIDEVRRLLVVRDEPDDFAYACIKLLNDSTKRKEISALGHVLIATHYSWEAAGRKLNDLVGSI